MVSRSETEDYSCSTGAVQDLKGRDLPVLTDYRSMIGGLAARQYGLAGDRLGTVFPAAKPVDLQLI